MRHLPWRGMIDSQTAHYITHVHNALEPTLIKAAAQVDGEPCVTYLDEVY